MFSAVSLKLFFGDFFRFSFVVIDKIYNFIYFGFKAFPITPKRVNPTGINIYTIFKGIEKHIFEEVSDETEVWLPVFIIF